MFTLISRKRKAQLLADNLALAQENAILRRSLRLANVCIDSWKNEAMELRGEGKKNKQHRRRSAAAKPASTVGARA